MVPSYSTPAPPPIAPDPRTLNHGAASARGLGRAFGAGIVVFFFATCALGVTAVLTPRYAEIFRDFGVTLPVFTRGFLTLGRALTTPMGILLAGLAVLLLSLVAGAIAGGGKRAALLLHMLAVALFIIYLGAFLASMQLPLAAMTGSLQQQSTPQP